MFVNLSNEPGRYISVARADGAHRPGWTGATSNHGRHGVCCPLYVQFLLAGVDDDVIAAGDRQFVHDVFADASEAADDVMIVEYAPAGAVRQSP